MSDNSSSSSSGVSILGLLGVLFIGLKLTGFINWSWWLVLLPLYGGFVLFVVVLAVCFGVGVVRALRS